MREYAFYVYILLCSDGSYYTGMTNDYRRRLRQHQEGLNPRCYTFTRRPVTLVYAAEFQYVHDAIAWEHRVKRWSRKKKEALIVGDWEGIQKLAVCQNGTHHRFFEKEKKKVNGDYSPGVTLRLRSG